MRDQFCVGVDASRAVSAHPTGTETYSRELIAALLGLDTRASFRLYFRSAPPPGAFPGADLRVISFPRLWTHLRLSWEMARHPPDLLFVPAHVLPPIRPSLSLVTVHDLGYIRFPRAHPTFQRLYLHLSTWWNVRAATHVLADSQVTKDDLIERYRVPPGKVTVAHLGYDRGLAPTADPSALTRVRELYDLPERYFLYLGTLQPRKNLTLLVDALAAARPETSLVLAGRRGWMYEDLYARVRLSGMEDRVIFPGYIPQEDKAALLSGAVGFLFPSLYEGFGLPVLEAQACDCPVVCSNTSSLPEVAGDGAILLGPQDVAGWARAMNRLDSEAELRAQLIGRGRANLARFSWKRCAETVLGTIESLAASRP